MPVDEEPDEPSLARTGRASSMLELEYYFSYGGVSAKLFNESDKDEEDE